MSRNKSVDVARALLILYIVTMVHAAYWLNIGSSPLRSWGLFEMPAIFFLAGFTYSLTAPASPVSLLSMQYLVYCRSKAARLLPPYWAYAAVCLVIALMSVPGSTTSDVVAAYALAWLNPFSYGKNHSVSMLNYHLWFVAPFLCIAILFPVFQHAHRILGAIKIEFSWVGLLFATVGLTLLQRLLNIDMTFVKTMMFYAAWSALGYAMGSGYRIPQRVALLLLTTSLGLLVFAGLLGQPVIDMQKNKLPPNAFFFLFSSAWMAVFIIASPKVPSHLIDRLYEAWWLKPFRRYGYSIYMWQGVSYTLVTMAGGTYGWPHGVRLVAAVMLTIALGIAASPLENVGRRKRAELAQIC
ncbi:acyltransferase family protein [Pseudoduganella namucuonensis]|uniref:Peptidoglycan/LPS O-acetylase OafA/YrhL, contains acyltransferase and SGNH-hydrolase domains n=1 Tax=Pseudoduganella namucuonensis TaxID=1035707 RepID=A0A1I7GF82_9BURK|nr:acyltransferase [Pseudoduganella namucuonensis]SFU47109.1 Peptidoglycan/LPS O-acetylase OafA/YrhL, contains acyltransferase and SGNH-hydrolase domains [Pseudoduganella namucuonensis]